MPAKVVMATLNHILATLEPTHCPYALIGGLSLSFWKLVRSTQDIDLLIDPGPGGIEPILKVLRQAGVRTKHHPPLVDLGSVRLVQLLYEPKEAFMDIQIDLLLAESEFHREALEHRVQAWISDGKISLFTLSCEDLLILKMNAGRVIDRADGAALLRLNRDGLNLSYLLKWVKNLKLEAEWTGLWNEAFPVKPLPESL